MQLSRIPRRQHAPLVADASATCFPSPQRSYDTLITGGRLIDVAAGINDEFRDIALRDGKVVDIAMPGRLRPEDGLELFDATGLCVVPQTLRLEPPFAESSPSCHRDLS